MEEKDFWSKYWYTNLKLVTVSNPTTEDYEFSIMMDMGLDPLTGKIKEEQRHYLIKAGSHERFPGVVANMYLDQMTKKLAQMEDKIQHLIDFSLRAKYYDELTVDIDDLVQNYQPKLPDYLQGNDTKVIPEEKAFEGAKDEPKTTGTTSKEVAERPGNRQKPVVKA